MSSEEITMPFEDAYLESQVMTADPLELVRMLYRAAGEAARSAGAHMRAGRISERARQISKVYAILSQLSRSLDHGRGGVLSGRLAQLYDYMQRRLLEANLKQIPEPLDEVERLLGTLQSGWDSISAPAERPAPRASTADYGEGQTGYGGYAAAFAPVASLSGSHCWSF
jgi:flagellar secretion chaperone FliS